MEENARRAAASFSDWRTRPVVQNVMGIKNCLSGVFEEEILSNTSEALSGNDNMQIDLFTTIIEKQAINKKNKYYKYCQYNKFISGSSIICLQMCL